MGTNELHPQFIIVNKKLGEISCIFFPLYQMGTYELHPQFIIVNKKLGEISCIFSPLKWGEKVIIILVVIYWKNFL
jgi:hypothetical protein